MAVRWLGRGGVGGWGGARSLGAIDAPFVLFIYYKSLNILLNFFNETITLFLKQLEVNFKDQWIFQCHKQK